ncbi:hypothetical protein EPA93_25440 [Ktedonosporobacter rubrisoli]|uniref:Dipeptidylpeptidase IV N-terminal domain-containing protein n=1 Tax=Ktedonosporobacter rubrisoli TaxID=2509675 RepID=A0A4V0YZB5_KTERU|nr:PD40 domain-containing protein [Ktedonosporobacter rubrisoli]QBD79141.1 hypothetical protein EPA93_25440 [Ktedonosporobacter rubrisoli]
MTQQVSSPPEKSQKKFISQPLPRRDSQLPKKSGVISLLVIVGLLLILFTALIIRNLPQAIVQPDGQQTLASAGNSQEADSNGEGPLEIPGKTGIAPLELSSGRYVLYEQEDALYLASVAGDEPPQLLSTPGYVYNRATPPILTPAGQVIYSGNGLWITDLSGRTPKKIANVDNGQVVTSMVLSKDGSTIAWSSEPSNGNGTVNLYAGPLMSSSLIYQHSADDCPCFRVFSFLDSPGQKDDTTTLLLTDDRGDHHAVQYGLWTLKLTDNTAAEPEQILSEETPQTPLEIAPNTNTLLYSSYAGTVPAPSDGSVPDDIAELNYANSLFMAPIDGQELTARDSHVLLPEQHELSNSAEYHWVTTPQFSPDGRTLTYVVFSSDAQMPFRRHSALYTAQIKGSGKQLKISSPQVLAVTTARFVELGPWLDNHTLTFYADNAIYALDVNTGAVATIAQTKSYARIVAMLNLDTLATPTPQPQGQQS